MLGTYLYSHAECFPCFSFLQNYLRSYSHLHKNIPPFLKLSPWCSCNTQCDINITSFLTRIQKCTYTYFTTGVKRSTGERKECGGTAQTHTNRLIHLHTAIHTVYVCMYASTSCLQMIVFSACISVWACVPGTPRAKLIIIEMSLRLAVAGTTLSRANARKSTSPFSVISCMLYVTRPHKGALGIKMKCNVQINTSSTNAVLTYSVRRPAPALQQPNRCHAADVLGVSKNTQEF